MKKLECIVRFNTPAFLGNAEQKGQWRTPPFKALLRQWWRVAYAAEHGGKPAVDRMRDEEGRLFGVATDIRAGSQKSQVRLRLDQWLEGQLKDWAGLDSSRVVHPEVKNRDGKPVAVGAHLYLGYGPLGFARGQTALKKNAAIQADESATLSIACPDDALPLLQRTVSLIDRYGTIGGRSRNGWGSFGLSPSDAGSALNFSMPPQSVLRPWRDALDQDWPHAIGSDEQGALVWQTTEPTGDWKEIMRQLAVLKIGMRTTLFPFNSGNGAARPEPRHWLGYPVTKHSVRSWGNARLPNSLRFKVRADTAGNLRGVIFHVPCLPPQVPFHPDRRAIETVWKQVHTYLDGQAPSLIRIPA